jgi:DNA-binding NtrC family response regulator
MEKSVVVLDADKEQCLKLCAMLDEWEYRATPMHSLSHLEGYMQSETCSVVIMDIDTVPVDNRTIRNLRGRNPEVFLLCLSKDRLHPELNEALSSHIFACINRPIDEDELFYWLRSICHDSRQ